MLVEFYLVVSDNIVKLMQKRKVWSLLQVLLVSGGIVTVGATAVFAQSSSTSPNYQVTETQFGAGSSLQSCSGQYCARVTIGEATDGVISSNATFGEPVDGEPKLEVIIEPGVSNLGVLSTENTATKTTTVKINNYLSGGYTLQVIGTPPKFGNHTLAAPTVPTPSRPGTEQFAINAVANTSPAIGIGPTQVPSGQLEFGTIAQKYGTPNQFMYVSEDVIASSKIESSRVDYTISMIINISNGTPAGHYAGDFGILIVPAY